MRWVVTAVASASVGCLSGDICKEATPCPPPAPDACAGVCAPFVSGLWSPVLVSSSSQAERCPSAAPSKAMATSTMIACGVQEAEGECSSDELVCLRGAAGWAACVIRDGRHSCPTFYEMPVDVGDTITLCCPSDEPPG